MRQLGYILIAIGLVWLLAAMGMETSVQPSLRTNDLGMWDGQIPNRVENIGLLARRDNHLFIGGLITLIGTLMTIFGGRTNTRTQKPEEPEPLPPAPPAERDINSDAYRLWLAKHYQIERNELFERFVISDKTFSDLDAALQHAHSIELAKTEDRKRAAQLEDEERERDREEREWAQIEAQGKWEAGKNNRRVAFGITVAVLLAGFLLAYQGFTGSTSSPQRLEKNTVSEGKAQEAQVDKSALPSPTATNSRERPPMENAEAAVSERASNCSGYYAYIPEEQSWAFSVEVQGKAVEFLSTDYSNLFGRAQTQDDGSVQFNEGRGDPLWHLRCRGDTATLEIPANEYQAARKFDLARSDVDVYEIAERRGWQLGE